MQASTQGRSASLFGPGRHRKRKTGQDVPVATRLEEPTPETAGNVRVLIAYQHLPHYRLGVFKELAKWPGLTVTFAAGESNKYADIPSIRREEFERHVDLKNRWIGDLLWQSNLVGLSCSSSFDVYVFLGDVHYITTWLAAAIARARRKRVLFWTIGWHRPDRRPASTLRLLFYRISDGLLLYGVDGLEIGRGSGFDAAKMMVVGNSLESAPREKRHTIEHSERYIADQLDPDRVYIGSIVRLNPTKRLDLLLIAAKIVAEDVPNVGVLIVGEGPEEGRLRELAESLGIHCLFLGGIYDDELISQVYQHMRVTVLPQQAGLTTIQSMKHGRPVISAQYTYLQAPEFRAIVPGRTGDLYPVDDVTALAEAVSRWLAKVDEDPEGVASDCRSEVEVNWSAHASAKRIVQGILGDPWQ